MKNILGLLILPFGLLIIALLLIWAQESKEMEIVGNIYEDGGLLNPALVKGQMKLF